MIETRGTETSGRCITNSSRGDQNARKQAAACRTCPSGSSTRSKLEAIAEESASEADRLEERARILARCIEKLPDRHRLLLRVRYSEGRGIDAISRELGRSMDAVYRALSRIRQTLQDCVNQTLAQGEHP